MKPRKTITQDLLATALETHILAQPSDYIWDDYQDLECERPHLCTEYCANDIFERLVANPTENSQWSTQR